MINRITLKAGVAPLALGIALVGSPAFAQEESSSQTTTQSADVGVGPVEAADTPGTGAIVVTGSRIKQPNLESASPVTVVSAQEFKDTGTTRVEDLVNSLPQVFAGQGSNISNGASGTATLNLRGLGSERTLVLLNGRRLVPGDPSTSAADINVIPAAMIKRVDVLTGGASSVYGADAVAGVVNFVMDTEFEGFKLDTQYSVYNHDNRNRSDLTNALGNRAYPRGMVTDGGTFDITAAFGTSFDDGRGHATAYIGYRNIKAVTQANRDYSACALSATTGGGANPYTCSGSATSPTGTLFYYDSFGDPTDLTGGGPDGDMPNGVADSFTSTIGQFGPNRTLLGGFTPYNFNPRNYFQRPDERYTAGFFADYEISEAVHPYAEFMFMDDRTVAQIAESGDFGNTVSLNCDNPLLSASQKASICDTENLLVSPLPGDAFTVVGNVAAENAARAARNIGEPLLPTTPFNFIDPLTGNPYNRAFAQILRRNVEGGPRRDDLQHTSYRAVLGVKGDLSPAWSYDAYYQYGRTNFAETYFNDFSVTRLTRALDVVTGPDGTPVCRSTLDGSDPNCVPYDIFSPGTTPVSQAAVNYLGVPGFQRGVVTEQVASAYLSGALGEYGIQSPWADEGIGLVLGAEYRKEKLDFFSDLSFQTGDLAGQGAPTLPVAGEFNVKEIFTEVRIPIANNSWVYDFNITGGYRYSDYSTGNQTDTYKIEGEFAPIRDIRIRGGYNRAVRAPTVQDLFAPQRVALDGSTDPCSGAPIAAGDVGCLAQGLTVGQVVAPNPASQYNGLIGGNPNLVPEVADTYTAGVVLQPRFIPGFALSVDYFNIEVTGAIQGIGADTILDNCDRDSADPFFCGLITRDPSGSLWRTSNGYVTDLSQNIGTLKTSGVDVQANYTHEIGSFGRAGLSFVGTYLNNLTTNAGVGGDVECVNRAGNQCGTPNPEWRHQARLSFDMPNGMGASVRWRYFSPVNLDGGRPGASRFDAQNYFDLALTWEVGDHYNFRLGANNILDREPPITGSQACPAGSCNGNAFAQVYDALGRYLYAGVTLDF
jgi:outer membrane receptor protein involved in Fe transport